MSIHISLSSGEQGSRQHGSHSEQGSRQHGSHSEQGSRQHGSHCSRHHSAPRVFAGRRPTGTGTGRLTIPSNRPESWPAVGQLLLRTAGLSSPMTPMTPIPGPGPAGTPRLIALRGIAHHRNMLTQTKVLVKCRSIRTADAVRQQNVPSAS
jgi:hypothetical protein